MGGPDPSESWGALRLGAAQQSYQAAKRAARQAVARDKKQHWARTAAELERLLKKGNLHEACKQVRIRAEILPAKAMPEQMKDKNGKLVIGKKEKSQLKKEYFSELLNVAKPTCADVMTVPQAAADDVYDLPPSLEEVVEAIQALKCHKAAGVCSAVGESLKYGGMHIKSWLYEIILEVWQSGKAPEDWKKALIVPVFKLGDASMLDDYRGISLLSIPAKVDSLILNARLKTWIDKQLLEIQFGFQAGRECTDANFLLSKLLEDVSRKGQKVCQSFIDIKKAYDCVPRHLLWPVLERREMPPRLVDLLRDLHENTQSALRGNHKHADGWFAATNGLKQGDVNAPVLFNLFFDTVIRAMQPLLQQAGVHLLYRIDGNLQECKRKSFEFSCMPMI